MVKSCPFDDMCDMKGVFRNKCLFRVDVCFCMGICGPVLCGKFHLHAVACPRNLMSILLASLCKTMLDSIQIPSFTAIN